MAFIHRVNVPACLIMVRRLAGIVRIVPGVIATCRHWRRAIGFHRCRAEVWGSNARVGA